MPLHSSYLARVLSPISLTETINSMALELSDHLHSFDTIAFRGSSGLLVGPSLAVKLGKQMLMVRKPDDGAHSPLPVEGNVFECERFIIADDIVFSGNTIFKTVQRILTYCQENKPAVDGKVILPKCAGVITFDNKTTPTFTDRMRSVLREFEPHVDPNFRAFGLQNDDRTW